MADDLSRPSEFGALLRIARSALVITIAVALVFVLFSPGVGHAREASGVGLAVPAPVSSLDPAESAEVGAQCSCQVIAPFLAQQPSFTLEVSPLRFDKVDGRSPAGRSPSPPTRPPRG